jgi:hypothetical protein
MEYVSIWETALSRLRPELSPPELETVVHAALGAVNSIAFHDAGLPADVLEARLGQAARTVLTTG